MRELSSRLLWHRLSACAPTISQPSNEEINDGLRILCRIVELLKRRPLSSGTGLQPMLLRNSPRNQDLGGALRSKGGFQRFRKAAISSMPIFAADSNSPSFWLVMSAPEPSTTARLGTPLSSGT